MLRKNPKVSISANGRIELELQTLADALAFQKMINDSITQAIQSGDWGAQNGVDCDGDASHIRVAVRVGRSEQNTMASVREQ